jgi:ribosomal protein S27AE
MSKIKTKGLAKIASLAPEEALLQSPENHNNKLKSCPFCGEAVEIAKHHKEDLWWLIHRCKVMGPLTIDWRGNQESIVRQWNTRVKETE